MRGVALSPPTIPYISNVTGTWITADQATNPDYYAAHLRQPVRFEAGVRSLAADPSLFFLEVGPGNALATLARATLGQERANVIASSLSRPRGKESDKRMMLEAAGRLWLSGGSVAWQETHADARPRRIPLPTYPFERTLYVVDKVPGAAAIEAGGAKTRTDLPASTEGVQRLYAPSWMRDESVLATRPRVRGVWVVFADQRAANRGGGRPAPSRWRHADLC